MPQAYTDGEILYACECLFGSQAGLLFIDTDACPNPELLSAMIEAGARMANDARYTLQTLLYLGLCEVLALEASPYYETSQEDLGVVLGAYLANVIVRVEHGQGNLLSSRPV